MRPVAVGLSLILVMAAAGCASRSAGAPTPNSQQAMQTAEAIAQLTSEANPPTPSPAAATSTAVPTQATSTPVPSATSTSPIATAKYAVAVRDGPGEEYNQVDLFLQGQTAEVYGQNSSSTIGAWYFIHRIGAGKDGWVWSGAVDFSGNPGLVPSMEAPPVPTGPSATP